MHVWGNVLLRVGISDCSSRLQEAVAHAENENPEGGGPEAEGEPYFNGAEHVEPHPY